MAEGEGVELAAEATDEAMAAMVNEAAATGAAAVATPATAGTTGREVIRRLWEDRNFRSIHEQQFKVNRLSMLSDLILSDLPLAWLFFEYFPCISDTLCPYLCLSSGMSVAKLRTVSIRSETEARGESKAN